MHGHVHRVLPLGHFGLLRKVCARRGETRLVKVVKGYMYVETASEALCTIM